MVHMSLACVRQIIKGTSASAVQLNFQTLPAIVLAMLQMKRFTTLVAAAIDLIKIAGQSSRQIHEQLVLHNGLLDALKAHLDEDQFQSRVVTVFSDIALSLTHRGLQQLVRSKVVKSLFNTLSNFRMQGTSTQVAMQASSAAFNFPLVKGVLRASCALLQVSSKL